MKNWKNHVKLLLCVCAMSGLAACGSSDSSSSSNLSKSNQDTLSIGIDGVLYSETETEDSSIEISNVENSIYTISGGSNEGELTTTSSNRDILISTIESDSLVLMPIGDNPIDEVDITITRAGDANYNSISITLSFKLKNSQTPLTLSLDGNLVPDYTEIMILTTDANLTYAIDGDSGSGACSVVEGDTDAIESTINDDCTQLTINPHTIGTETITLKKTGNNTYLEAILDITFIVGVTVKQNQVIYLGANANTYTDGTIIKDYSETTPTFTEPFNGENVVSEVTFTQQYSDSDTDDDVVQVNPNEDNTEVTFTIVGAGTETLTITKAGTDDFNEIEVIYTITIAQISQEPITLAEATFPEGVSIDDENKLTGLVYNSNGTDTDSHATLTLNGGSSPEPFQISVDDEDVGVSTTFLNTTLTLIPDDGATITPEEFMITKNGDRNYLDASITLQVSVLKANPTITGASNFTDNDDGTGTLIGLVFNGASTTLNLNGDADVDFVIDVDGTPQDGAEASITDSVFTIDPKDGAIGNGTEMPEIFRITRAESKNYNSFSFELSLTVAKAIPILTIVGDSLETGVALVNDAENNTSSLTSLIYNGTAATLNLSVGEETTGFSIDEGVTSDGAEATIADGVLTIDPSQGAIGNDSEIPEAFIITRMESDNYEAITSYTLNVSVLKITPVLTVAGDNLEAEFTFTAISDIKGELTGLIYDGEEAILDLMGDIDAPFTVGGGTDNAGAIAAISMDKDTLTITPSSGSSTVDETFMITNAGDENYNATAGYSLTIPEIAKADQDAITLPSEYADVDDYEVSLSSHGLTSLDILVSGGSGTGTITPTGHDTNNLMASFSDDTLQLEAIASTGTEIVTISKVGDNDYQDSNTITLIVSLSSDVDLDHDGLIDIWSLEQLSNIRFDLDGSHYRTSDGDSGSTSGCPSDVCSGYELMQDLDFTKDDSYNGTEVDSKNDPSDLTNTVTTTKAVWTPQLNGIQVTPASGANTGWRPIGGNNTAPFTGTFDGKGFTISNLYHRSTGSSNAGLFRTINKSSILKNLSLDTVYVLKKDLAAGLAGSVLDTGSGGSIDNCHITGNSIIEATSSDNSIRVGGITALNRTEISNSSSSAQITGSSTNNIVLTVVYSGGLVGEHSSGSISHSYATGAISSSYASSVFASSFAGGLVGYQTGSGSISYSYATGAVNASIESHDYSSSSSGGLVGYQNNGSITHSYATGTVEATNNGGFSNSGGLLGYQANGSITHSYATGAVNASYRSGGLVGRQDANGAISYSYATGAVSNSFISGDLVGGDILGTVISSCGSDNTNDGAEADSKLIDLLESSNASSGDVAIHSTWQCYNSSDTLVVIGDANTDDDSITLFEEWGKYFYDADDSNAVKSNTNIYDADNDIYIWDFSDTTSLPTIVLPPNTP